MTRSDLKHVYCILSAESLMNIAEKRLCDKAELETQVFMGRIATFVEPELRKFLVPMCVREGFCREAKSCGFCGTLAYKQMRKEYITQ